AARGPFIGQRKGARIFPPQGCRSSDSDSQPEDVERSRTTPHRGRSEAALGRVPASEGNRLGQTYATSPGEASLNTMPFERSRSHGRRYACLLVEAFSSTAFSWDSSLGTVASTMQNGYSSGRFSIFGMLTIEPNSSLLPVGYRFKFQ